MLNRYTYNITSICLCLDFSRIKFSIEKVATLLKGFYEDQTPKFTL